MNRATYLAWREYVSPNQFLAFLFAIFFSGSSLFAQNQTEPCGTMWMDSIHRAKYDLSPLSEFEDWIAPLVKDIKQRGAHRRATVETFPLLFHIIHNGESYGSGRNVSPDRIISQIEVLNEDFRRQNADASQTPEEFEDVAADPEIEFCLAGIRRHDRNDFGWLAPPYSDCYVTETIKPATIEDPYSYINVWVVDGLFTCSDTSFYTGFAVFPEGSGNPGLPSPPSNVDDVDGVVIITNTLGASPINPNSGPYNLGRLATHELGHFFGLRHIWGDGDCDDDDFCDDTPDQDGENYGCPNRNSCEDSPEDFKDMIENYMDYSDHSCQNLFTLDQKARMRAVVDNSPRRMELPDAGSCCSDDFASISPTLYSGYGVSCHNSSDGQLTANGGGVGAQFEWSTGSHNQTISNLSPGNYTVTVEHGSTGCLSIANYTITAPPAVSVNANATSNYSGYDVSCNGGSDGMAEAYPSGGVGGFSYSWSVSAGSQNTKIATDLSAGTHYVTVTDANGCTKSTSVTLTEPPVVVVSAAATSDYNGYNVSCNGGSDGVAEAYPGGGVDGFTYLWSASAGNQITKEATGLTAGTHHVTVTDANGCSESTSVTLTEPDPLVVNAGENQTVYFGYPDSACADLMPTEVSGGVPPYQYSWSTGETNEAINVCPEVTTIYTLTITDDNGCVMSDEVKICVVNVLCTNGNGSPKIEICHKSNNGETNTLCIGINAAAQHFAHGDRIAACDADRSCEDVVAKKGATHGDEVQMGVYPNPFDAYTTIRFKAVKDDHATVRVLDVSGREVLEAFNNRVLKGERYRINISGERLATGIYFCILQFGDGTIRSEKLVFSPR